MSVCFARISSTALIAACVLTGVQGIRSTSGLEGNAGNASSDRTPSKYFLWFADIHADPLYGSAPERGYGGQQCRTSAAVTKANIFGTFGCDPPYSLMQSAATAAAQLTGGAHPEFVLSTGDEVRHGVQTLHDPKKEVIEIMGNVINITRLAVKGVEEVRGIQGNDDKPQNYHQVFTTGQLENDWSAAVGDLLVAQGSMPSDLEHAYKYGNFYEREVGGFAYSKYRVPKTPILPRDPFHQFSWLKERLLAAVLRNKTVWIVGHVPPGIESYGYTELWHSRYLHSYLEIVQDPLLGRVVAAQLFGHVHSDEFRLLPHAPPGAGHVLTSGSLSPVFGNNPSFRLVEYNPRTGGLLSFKAYYAELTEGSAPLKWKLGYDLQQAYPVLGSSVKEKGALLQPAFASLAEEIGAGQHDFDTYTLWYMMKRPFDLQACSEAKAALSQGSGSTGAGTMHLNATERLRCREALHCSFIISDQSEYDRCAGQEPEQSLGLHAILEKLQELYGDDFYYKWARLVHWVATKGLEKDIEQWISRVLSSAEWIKLEEWAAHVLEERHEEAAAAAAAA